MKLRKTTRITVETDQVVIIRRRRLTRFWCTQCQREEDFVPVEEVNHLLERHAPPATDPVAPEGLHFARTKDGSTVICVRSLLGV